MVRLAAHERTLLRSQSPPYTCIALSAAPSNFLNRIEPALFRVLLIWRLRLPLPLSSRLCRCGRPLDSFGHHRAVCARAGVLGRRGFAIESTGARICREAGDRVTVNMRVRDMDLALPQAQDRRRLEIVADGLALFGGMQLAVVSPLHCGGTARPGAGDTGVALVQARRKKERTYPVGGLGWREGGAVGPTRPRSSCVFWPAHQGQSGIAHPPWQGRASGDSSILSVQRCSGLRCISFEPQTWEGC